MFRKQPIDDANQKNVLSIVRNVHNKRVTHTNHVLIEKYNIILVHNIHSLLNLDKVKFNIILKECQ